MAVPFFVAEAAQVTVMRRLASSAYGDYTLNLPDGIDVEDVHDFDAPGNKLGYVASLQSDRRVGRFGRRFIRADVSVTAMDPSDPDRIPDSDVHAVFQDAYDRVSSDFFLESDITKVGRGSWVPYVDFKVGDPAVVDVVGHKVILPVTRIEPQKTDHDDMDYLVHVGGQIVSDEQARLAENLTLNKKVLQDRREIFELESATKKAQDTADSAQVVADGAKQESSAAKLAADRAITENTVQYAVGDSDSAPPASGWDVVTPQRTEGQFIWFRAVVTYGDGQTKITAPALLTGDAGTPGGTTYLHVAYATSEDGLQGFSTTDPSGKTYIGTYADFVESDSEDHTKYTWILIKGEDGTAGIGVKSTVVEYQAGTSGTSAPQGAWAAGIPGVAQGWYLWTRVTQLMDDGAQIISYSVARQGENGDPGADGRSVTSTTMHYARTSSGTAIPGASEWRENPWIPVQGQYTWTRTTWGFSDNTVSVGYSVAYLGTDGEPGSDGNGVSGAVIAYQISQSGVTPPTGAWLEEIPALSPGDWLWTRTVWALDDGQTKTAYSVAYVGENGRPGDNGVGIVAVVPWWRYQLKTDPAPETPSGEIPAGWVNVEPEYLPNRYLWQTLQVEFSNGVFTFSQPSRSASFLASDQAIKLGQGINEALTGSITGDLTEALADSSTAIGRVAADAETAKNWTVDNQTNFNLSTALALSALEQVSDVNAINWETTSQRFELQSEIDQAQNTTARLAFPHLSITPADSDGRPYWSYGGASTSSTPDGSYVSGDPSTFSWAIDSVFPGSTVDDAYFYVTPNIDLKVGHSSYKWNIAGTSTIGVAYIGFVDEAGNNAVEAWKDDSTTTGEWFTTSEASAPTVKSEWMSGNHVFRIKPGVTKVRPTVRVLERTSINGLHISAWFPIREDMDKIQFDFRESTTNRVQPLETAVSDHGQRLDVLESGETWRALGARRGVFARDAGYVNISWPSNKRASLTWAAGANFDIIFEINYVNGTSNKDAFNTLADFPGEWGMSLGTDSGNTDIRAASAQYFRSPGVGHSLVENTPEQIIPGASWFNPVSTNNENFGWIVSYTASHKISASVEWRHATADTAYGIALFVNNVNVHEESVTSGLGPIEFWKDGRRTQSFEWEGNLSAGDDVRIRLYASARASDPEASQRKITGAEAKIFWIEK